tara:strand:+ start:367 stop:717 length:351 start_codon:yes stop_codon:yes gene_type:complete
MTDTNGNKRELKYFREFFMLALLGLVGWTLVSTVETSKNVAVLAESFKNMQISFAKLETAVEKGTEKRYDSGDAEKDITKLMALIEKKTELRYNSDDADRDKKELIHMIQNHKHNR